MDYIEKIKENIFYFNENGNILQNKFLGICADIASVMTPDSSVFALNTFQGCPITNTAFKFEIRIDGETIKTKNWHWVPNAIVREGNCGCWSAETLTVVAPYGRGVVQKIKITNNSDCDVMVPIQIQYQGHTRYESVWAFSVPKEGNIKDVSYRQEKNMVIAQSDDCSYIITSSIDMKMFELARLYETQLPFKPGETIEFYVSFHIGKSENAYKEAQSFLNNYEEKIIQSFLWLDKRCSEVTEKIPKFHSDCKELDKLYYQSLVTYILCRWDNTDLFAPSYYSTGSVNGACMCSYLWDYCGGLMLHPIVDPEVNKEEIKAYLRIDLTKSYALNPVEEKGVGPWYQVNQEKVILMVYYHVLHTGDVDFLYEKVGDKTVIQWMISHAYVCDDINKPVALYDYGEGGNDHLELRRGIPYNGIMPDLNARRYMNYVRVYELSKIAGCPDEKLMERANVLKERLKDLWDEDDKWYVFIRNGVRETRYTVQMFKFLNSPVIDDDTREGLISHLNEQEFLSKFGLHSMSKKDIAYDQDDIDNGGGGICTHFTMQICAQLYEIGKSQMATDILKRVLWWGRLPYLGDSCAANMLFNREDTPLQGDISSVSCAQMMIFYLLGIYVSFDGTICIRPAKFRPADKITADNIKIRDKEFSIHIDGDTFSVIYNGTENKAPVGEEIVI
ncbi:MAG: hypothetical protein II998_03645 [Clostridia bacterium]|nr:hypothetical protein [Clostridia bacterium]